MKKLTKELKEKTVEELESERKTLLLDISRLGLEKKVKMEKNTNGLRQKKKRLAVVMTLLTGKHQLDK